MTLPFSERFRIHPASVLTVENSAWECSVWEALLHPFPRINQHWRNMETTRTYCIRTNYILSLFAWWDGPKPMFTFLCYDFLRMLTRLCARFRPYWKSSKLLILFSSKIFSDISKILCTTTFLNTETTASDINSGCRKVVFWRRFIKPSKQFSQFIRCFGTFVGSSCFMNADPILQRSL
jgi:hypothetical protein